MSLTHFLSYFFSSISSSFWLGRSVHYRWSQILYQVSADENTQSSPIPFYTRSLSLQCVWDKNNQYNIVVVVPYVLRFALKIRKFCTYDSRKFRLSGRKVRFCLANSWCKKCLVLRHIFGWAKVAYVCNAAAVIFDFITKDHKRVQKFQLLG